MPVLKVKKNGVWEAVSGMSEHTHNMDNVVQIETEIVFPETALDVDADGYWETSGFIPESGEVYEIIVNGVSYTCPAYPAYGESIALGDEMAVSYPFFIIFDNIGLYGMFYDGASAYTLKVTRKIIPGQSCSIYTMGNPLFVDFYTETNGSDAIMVPVTVGQIKRACEANRQVIARISYSNMYYNYIPMDYAFASYGIVSFTGFTGTMGTTGYASITLISDEANDDDLLLLSRFATGGLTATST